MDLNWIDYSILGIIVFSTLISLVRGFVREVFSLVIWAAAFFIAIKLTHVVADNFLNTLDVGGFRYPIAFFIVFLLVLIAGAILSYAIGRLVYQTGLSGTDRVLGLAFGLTRGVLLVGVLLLVAAITNLNQHPAWAQSRVLPQFSGLVNWLYAILPDKIDMFAQLAEKEAQKKLGISNSLIGLDQASPKEKVTSPMTTVPVPVSETPTVSQGTIKMDSLNTSSVEPIKTSALDPIMR